MGHAKRAGPQSETKTKALKARDSQPRWLANGEIMENAAIVKQEKKPEGAALNLSAKVLAMIAGSGNLAELTLDERAQFIVALCDSVGLNPLSRPIEILEFDGRVIPYAKKECSDQLRQVHGISVEIVSRDLDEDGIFIVTARARDRDGRVDEDVGAVDLVGLKGTRLANAKMKAHTKAKRRVTLSIAGLSILDESEIDSLDDKQPTIAQRLGVTTAIPLIPSGTPTDPTVAACEEIGKARDLRALDQIGNRLANEAMTSKQRSRITSAFAKRRDELKKGAIEASAEIKPAEQQQAEEKPTGKLPCDECGAPSDEYHAEGCPVGEALKKDGVA